MSKNIYKQPIEYRKKLSLSKIESKNPNFGKKASLETKLKMSLAHKGKNNAMFGKKLSSEARLKISKIHKNKKLTQDTKTKIGLAQKGEKSHFWKGGISTHERKLWLNNKRRILKFNAVGEHTQNEWETLKAQYNWICPCCKKQEPSVTLSRDHIIPLTKGGSDNIENIQPLCRSCNSKKYNKIIKYE